MGSLPLGVPVQALDTESFGGVKVCNGAATRSMSRDSNVRGRGSWSSGTGECDSQGMGCVGK